MDNLKLRVKSVFWRQSIEFQAERNGAIGRPLVFDTPMSNPVYLAPTFSLSIDAAQILMDDLWNAGLRPTEGSGSAGALAATQRHLEDMRTLVFNK